MDAIFNLEEAIRQVADKLPDNPKGLCYIASEAVYHLVGGKTAGLTPMVIHHEGGTHWYLRDANWNFIDLTKAQFSSSVPYADGRGCGFLTKQPSRKTKEFMGWTN